MSDIKIVDWPKRPAEQRRDELEIENAELRKLLVWLLSGPKCTCKDHDCRWQQDKCACGYDEKMQAALKAAERGE